MKSERALKRIAVAEFENAEMKKAFELTAGECVRVTAEDLKSALEKVRSGEADAAVLGVDFSSREVILAARAVLGMKPKTKTFASYFACDFPDGRRLIIGDGATLKSPTADQLYDITRLIAEDAARLVGRPRIAMLSFSTKRSGGKHPTIDAAETVIARVRKKFPEWTIDGEIQLDAAVDERVGRKKNPDGKIKGDANILIVPDINAGNILAKSVEYLAGATVAGPVLVGFNGRVSDLSRGSTARDIAATLRVV